MILQLIGITILWLILYAYIIISFIDFGTGFYIYYGKWQRKERKLVTLISGYLSPLWEITNLLLILFIVGMITLFPSMSYYYGSTFMLPGGIAMILVMIRSSYYAFEGYGAKDSRIYMFIYGVTGLLIPAAFSTAFVISEGGLIVENDGGLIFSKWELLTSGFSWSIVIFAIINVLFVSACFLTAYAKRARDLESFEILRKFALFWSIPYLMSSILVFINLKFRNPEHFTHLLQIWWLVASAFVCFVIGVGCIYYRKYLKVSFIMVLAQLFCYFVAYGISHLPYILYPYVSVKDIQIDNMAVIMFVIIITVTLIILSMSIKYLLTVLRENRQENIQ